MSLIYTAFFLSVFFYFFAVRKRIDVYLAAFVGSSIYFMPALFGFVNYPVGRRTSQVEITSTTYFVYFLVVIAIATTALTSTKRIRSLAAQRNLRPSRSAGKNIYKVIHGAGRSENATVYTVHASLVFIFIISLISGGSDLVAASKSIVLAAQSRWFTYSCLVAVLLFICAASKDRPKAFEFIVPLIVLLFSFYIGHRSYFAFAIIGTILSKFNHTDILAEKRNNLLTLMFVFLAGAFLFVYKRVYIAVKTGDMSRVADTLQSDSLLEDSIYQSEPFLTQALLDIVVSRDFRRPCGNLLESFAQIVPFLENVLSPRQCSLTEFIYRIEATDVTYGIGSNIWADAYAYGGFLTLAVAVAVYCAILAKTHKTNPPKSVIFKSCFYFFCAILVFYIHRLDFMGFMLFSKRIFYIAVAIGVVKYLFVAFYNSGTRQTTRALRSPQ